VTLYLALLAFVLSVFPEELPRFSAGTAQIDSFKILITTEGDYIPYEPTHYTDLGPQVGDILNAHYFPAIRFYEGGRYKDAYDQLTYVLDRPTYINGNPGQITYLTAAYYLRGMILFYHTSGAGHLTLARQDFETAIQLNDRSYPAYLELSRLFSRAGLNEQAVATLQRLIELEPDKDTLHTAETELGSLAGKSK
jgi:tetratricopeptide (TPR) repeat protein